MTVPTKKPLWQRFAIFLLPLMLANVLQSLSGTINNIYIGQLLGVEALAAVSIFFPIMLFMISFVIGLASGATILIGQAWGAKNLEKVKQVTGTTLTTSVLLGLVVAVLGALFARDLLQLLGAPADILDDATAYARLVMIGGPGFFLFLTITSILRGVGDTMTPLTTLVFSIAVGLVVTPALIQGWFGLPQIGVLAAAVAFIVGFTVVLVYLYFYLNWRKSPMAPDAALIGHLRIDVKLLGLIVKLGLPAGMSMVVASTSALVIVGIVNQFGSNATAAYGAVNQVMSYVQFPAMSIGIAASIFAAQAIGAREMAEVGHVTRTAALMNVIVTGSFVLIAYLFSENLVRLFITDPEVIDLTETLLHIVLWSVVIFGFGSILSAVMRASGDVWVPMALSISAIALVEIPAALILSQVLGLNGVWIAYTMSFCALLVFQAIYYFGFWRKKEIRALV
jgi:putative MATE family efflux protein